MHDFLKAFKDAFPQSVLETCISKIKDWFK